MLQRMKAIPRPGLGKRTSSSSGFSSARSTQSSESSLSLSSDTNFPSPSALRRIQETESVVRREIPGPKQGMKARFGREKSSSPKRSPKLGRAGSELKDYGMIDSGEGGARHYPPHAYSRSNSGVSLKHTNISSSPRSSVVKTASTSSIPSASTTSIPSPRSGIRPPCPPTRGSSSSLEKRAGEGRRGKEVVREIVEEKVSEKEEKMEKSVEVKTEEHESESVGGKVEEPGGGRENSTPGREKSTPGRENSTPVRENSTPPLSTHRTCSLPRYYSTLYNSHFTLDTAHCILYSAEIQTRH